MFHGVAEEFVRDEKIIIPTSMTGGLTSFGALKYFPSYSAAMQIYLSTKKWTIGYFPVQFHKVSMQKYSRLRCLLRVKGLVICFHLGWSGSILQFRQNIIKVGSKSLQQ